MLIIWDYEDFYHCKKEKYGASLKGLKYKEKRPNTVVIYIDEIYNLSGQNKELQRIAEREYIKHLRRAGVKIEYWIYKIKFNVEIYG